MTDQTCRMDPILTLLRTKGRSSVSFSLTCVIYRISHAKEKARQRRRAEGLFRDQRASRELGFNDPMELPFKEEVQAFRKSAWNMLP